MSNSAFHNTTNLATAAAATTAYVNVPQGGGYMLDICGTFGGATVGIDILGSDGATGIPLRDTAGVIAVTAATAMLIALRSGRYRISIAGGAGVSIFAAVGSVD